MIAIDAGDLNEISDRGAMEGLSAAELSGARRPDDSCWTCSVAASDALRGKTTYGRSCSLGRVMPCSIVAEQRHKIIRKGVALVCEESVSGVTAELPPGRSGVPHHARLYHWHRRDHALPHCAGDTELRRVCRCIE